MRVFVSSTMGELAAERQAARSAIEQLRLTPVMFGSGARPHPPQSLYRAYLDQSDLFVGIYWQEYGWVAPGMAVSGLEDEFRLSDGMPRLLYLKRPAPGIEPGLRHMLDQIKADGRVSYKSFADAGQLRELMLGDLAAVLSERFTGPREETPRLVVPSPVTSLVGRDRDVEAVSALLETDEARLVVLTGTGGIGKTRVALAVAERTREHWPDGVAFVDLSAVTDPGSVPTAIVSALGPVTQGPEPPLETLARRLADRRMLLVLDNFEQVLEAAAVVAGLLERAPGLHVLVTSRVVLRVRGEHEWRVDPLGLAPADAGLAALSEAPAERLFVDRARDVRPGFELTKDNAAAVAELCRRLDGVPLALELAAAWSRLLTPVQMLSQLFERIDRPGALADLPARQQTLTATLDWSYGLLPQAAQQLLARLSVLAGTFTVEAASAVGGAGPPEDADAGSGVEADALEGLSVLLDHSMLSRASRPDGEPGFALLEVVRRFAAARLRDPDDAVDRLEHYLCGVLETASVQHGSQDWATRRLDSEELNLQTVLRRAAAGRRPAGELLRRLGDVWVWILVRPNSELTRLIGSFPAAGLSSGSDRIALYWLKAEVLLITGYHAQAGSLIDGIPPDVRRLTTRSRQGMLLAERALVRPYDPAGPARDEFEQSLAIQRESGDPISLGYVLCHFGMFLALAGDAARARALHEEIVPMARKLADDNQLAEAQYGLALDALTVEDLAPVPALLAAAVRLYQNIDHREGLARCLGALSALAAARGDGRLAARLIGATAAARDALGLEPWQAVAEFDRRNARRVASLLPAAEFRRQVEAGRAQKLDKAMAQALPVLAGG